MEQLFTFLFKYRPILFQEGDLTLAAPWPVLTVLGVGGVIATVAVLSYARPRGRATKGERAVMAGLRVGLLSVLLVCLLQPTLVLTSVVPQRNFVGVLLDDSRSMTLPDEDGEPRTGFVQEALGPEGELLAGLQERFAVRLFRFSDGAGRVGSAGELGWDGTRTGLATGLDRVREELSSVPLSGLVVVSDGADNAGRRLAEAVVPLQAASIPVYTVGLGEEALSPDIQVGRVEAPRAVLRGTSLVVDVVVSQRGFDGRTVPLVVESDRTLLAEEEVELTGAGEPSVVRVRFTLEEAGPQRIRFRVPVQDGELVDRNNERTLLLEVREDREKILYFEGEPRFEVKFVRRAVEEDENVQVVVLQRTAENKFLRLAVDSGDELAGGFPKTREELFQYRALILGSVEASFFTHDQLAMIADFVGQRGGGLLALGGRDAFAEGGYQGTPVAEALPVELEETPPAAGSGGFTQLSVRPTVAGRSHAATQIRAGAEASDELWDSLPPLSTLNRVTAVKPGATVLLTGEADGPDGVEERVVLAHHRYGRGTALALPVQDTWIWQMHADVPLEDMTHETFWQQLLRWLVDGVPRYVDVRPDRERAEAGETVRLVTEVNDSSYLAVNDARVVARVTAPDGTEEEVPLSWTVERDGEYAGTFRPGQDGQYRVAVEARRGAGDGEVLLGSDAAWVEVGPSDEEFFDAGQRRGALERLADETGGRYYTASSSGSLPEDIQFTGGGVTLTEERDLWDMPALLLLVIGFMAAEWGFRRARGLV